MSKDIQSIEDLTSGQSDEGSKQAQFTSKQAQIKEKELERLLEKKAEELGVSHIDLNGFPISPEALTLIKEEDARRLRTVCFYYDGLILKLGSERPQEKEVRELLEKLKDKYYSEGEVYLISPRSLNYALGLYRMIPKIREIARGVTIKEDDLNKFSEKFSSFKDLQDQIAKAEITEIVTMLLAAAVQARASDIHVEGEEKDIKVRLRIDGVLHDVAVLPTELWRKIISRLKLLTGVKINITDKPQDGRSSIHMHAGRIDIRASFLPTSYGESVVMRLLRSDVIDLDFDKLGIRGRDLKKLKQEISRPNGMIITTGPTGSGKTTTLYSILKRLNKPETKIITIEDPIEYQLGGINQSQISEKYTFAKGLRSVVRQDPDVIMVGEIRDLETAEIAIQASLTGHLVLSTLHTNDAAGTIPRFLSMGAKPFLLAPSLNAIIGQRLVRRICPECKKEVKLLEEELKKVKEILAKLPAEEKESINWTEAKFYRGGGCSACQNIGYKGRIGIYEIVIMNEDIEKIILSAEVSEYKIAKQAVADGTITMAQDGLLKALSGITSVEEVFRVAE